MNKTLSCVPANTAFSHPQIHIHMHCHKFIFDVTRLHKKWEKNLGPFQIKEGL